MDLCDSDDEDGTPEGSPAPCIIIMDSLSLHSSERIRSFLSKYLAQEWKKRRCKVVEEEQPESDVIADIHKLKLLKPKVPVQDNGCDCGMFVCQYVEEVYVRWPEVLSSSLTKQWIPDFTPRMFSVADIQVHEFSQNAAPSNQCNS